MEKKQTYQIKGYGEGATLESWTTIDQDKKYHSFCKFGKKVAEYGIKDDREYDCNTHDDDQPDPCGYCTCECDGHQLEREFQESQEDWESPQEEDDLIEYCEKNNIELSNEEGDYDGNTQNNSYGVLYETQNMWFSYTAELMEEQVTQLKKMGYIITEE